MKPDDSLANGFYAGICEFALSYVCGAVSGSTSFAPPADGGRGTYRSRK
jgi:hypothetical protein